MNYNGLGTILGALLISMGTFSSAQYCTAVGPTQTTWSNVESAFISGESATFIAYTGCPGVSGLEDYTSTQSVSLNANGNYTLNVQFGTCDNNWPGAGEAWIDFDGSETFDLGESIGTWQGTPPVAMSNFNFTVPSTCVNGPVRLRITQQEDATPPLNPCASFTWGCTIDFEVILSGGTGGTILNYCENVGPAAAGDSNLQELNFAGEGGSSINYIGCPGIVGFDNQTLNYNVDIASSNSYQAFITFGTCGGIYAGAGQAWIDYNINGIFESSESIGSWQGVPPGDTIFNFTAPGGLTYGTTRLRVVHQEGGVLPLDPCASFTWGSTTDFSVTIGDPVDCSGYEGDNTTDPRIVSTLPFQEDHSNLICYSNNVLVYNSPDVFYRLVPADYGVDYLNISLCGSAIDTYLQIHDNDGNVVASNDDYSECSPQSELSLYVGGYDTLFAVVQGWNNVKGDYSIAINDGEIVSIDEENVLINIYPNPSNGEFQINGLESFYQFQVYDLEGKLLIHSNAYQNETIDLSWLSTGMYVLHLNSENSQSIHKIIIDHE